MPVLHVLLYSADPLARAGLLALLSDAGEVAVTELADEAVPLNGLPTADVLLWDLGRHESLSAETIPAGLPAVVLLDDPGSLTEVWSWGVSGILRRDVDPERLLQALEAAAGGLVVVDADLAAALRPAPDLDRDPPAEELTERELEVLGLLADGLTNKAIARRLDISEHTVKFHVQSVLGKLGAQSRTQAVVRASRLGLIYL